MSKKIRFYTDKDKMNQIYPEIEKMNIKINSSTPTKTGRIIDGKEEYVIRLNLGTLPNNSTKGVQLPVSVTNVLITRPFFIWALSETEYSTQPSKVLSYYISDGGNQLNINTTTDMSRFTGYGELYYINKN